MWPRNRKSPSCTSAVEHVCCIKGIYRVTLERGCSTASCRRLIVCVLVAPIVAFRGRENLQIHVQPTAISHTNDIVIHFRTPNDDGVIFTTWNGHNNDYMKAYLQNGHVHLDTFIERSGPEVRYAISFLHTFITLLTACLYHRNGLA